MKSGSKNVRIRENLGGVDMIRSIFIDYTGTIIQEKGEDLEKLVLRIWKNSNFKNPEEIASSWRNQLKMTEVLELLN